MPPGESTKNGRTTTSSVPPEMAAQRIASARPCRRHVYATAIGMRTSGKTLTTTPSPSRPAAERSRPSSRAASDGDRQRGRQVVEAGADDRPEQERRERGERERGEHRRPAAPERAEADQHRPERGERAEQHRAVEDVLGSPHCRSRSSGAGRRAARPAGTRDGSRGTGSGRRPSRAVALVDRHVGDDDPVPDAEVEQRPGHEQQHDRTRDGEHGAPLGRLPRQPGSAPPPPRQAAPPARARQRRRRAGTTGCRGRTSGSARTRTRSAARR